VQLDQQGVGKVWSQVTAGSTIGAGRIIALGHGPGTGQFVPAQTCRRGSVGFNPAKYVCDGDGYLYYTGRSAANASFSIGRKSDIPIESARLMHARDGYEDYYEFLSILEAHEGRKFVMKQISPFISNAWTSADNARALLSARAAVGAAIETAQRDGMRPIRKAGTPQLKSDDQEQVSKTHRPLGRCKC
jgi:hypothetical protein